MANSVFFKEDPQQIADVAAKILKERNSFSTSLSGMKSKAAGMKAYWESDSANEYGRRAAELDAWGQELIKTLDGFISKLQQASGIYTTAESAALDASQGLPTDGVFR